jgi:hypothetical protein
MAKKKKKNTSKAIPVIRVANPWMVGSNVMRVVPLYALHNFACVDFVRFKGEQAIKHLVFDAKRGTTDKNLVGRFSVLPDELGDLERSVAGLLSPDRRVFRDKKRGGAGNQGALFPAVGGLLAPTGSDDGLGKRFRELMAGHDTDWRDRLKTLFGPAVAADPITGFAFRLLGNSAGELSEPPVPRRQKLTKLDQACAKFVDNVIEGAVDARRVPAIRRLAVAVYFAALIRLVAGPVERDKKTLPLVWAFGGLPPGMPGDPLVRATSKSFTQWIGQSWDSHARQLHDRLKAIPVPSRTPKADKLRRRVHAALTEQLPGQHRKLTAAAELMDPLVDGQELSVDWCREALQSDAIGFTKAELARRIRSLGLNVGFAAPNRGLLPRIVLDTPLLDVLVKGIAGKKAIPFSTFVTRLRTHFGIVVGIGNDASVMDQMQHFGSEGADAYELLSRNQELLRERLLRAGLARTYSDSLTEVFTHE